MLRNKILLISSVIALLCGVSVLFCVVQVKADDANVNTTQPLPLMHKGKPFFPIGAYSQPRNIDNSFVSFPELSKQGWNVVLQHVYDDKTDIIFLNEANVYDFAVILSMHNLVAAQDQNTVAKKVSILKGYPAVLGYYIFDEPENVFSESGEFKNSVHIRSLGLGKFIKNKLSWVKPLILKIDNNKEHYVFMCIGWSTFYRQLSDLCQINLPNEYPTQNTKNEFEGPQAKIAYDAKMGAEAAKAAGTSFCYTPFAININTGMEAWRAPTVNEFRYSAFAPITQGAMGIVFWAGYRCKYPYTEQVVFPVTRELNYLKSFFLGKWLDEKLRCEPSDRNTAILKKYDLPIVSGCLRQSEDGKYLLLAVNNTPDNVSATFTLDIGNLPTDVNEFVSKKTVIISDKIIHSQMRPYGVCAFIIEPKISAEAPK
jgi:hypothetical protein